MEGKNDILKELYFNESDENNTLKCKIAMSIFARKHSINFAEWIEVDYVRYKGYWIDKYWSDFPSYADKNFTTEELYDVWLQTKAILA